MNLKTILFLPIYLFSILIYSQSYSYNENKEFIVSGKVTDFENSEPLEYATITILDPKDNNVITGGLSDETGNFKISTKKGIYNVLIEYMSFKNQTIENINVYNDLSLGEVQLELNYESLGEVEIIAEETSVEIRLDKKIYTVGKDLSVRGGTANDVLDNIPSVSTDLDGNILLRGNDAARILINGKPSRLVGINSTFIKQLPADAIEKVEVITSPSARYEAEGSGGIINIILRKSKKLGLNGSLSANTGDPKANSLSSNINYRNGKINFFNSSSIYDRLRPGNSSGITEYYNGDNPSTFFSENRYRERDSKGYFVNNGFEWYIDDNSSLIGSFYYNDYKSDNLESNTINELDENSNILNSITQNDMEGDVDNNREYNINFERKFNDDGQKITIDFQYENSKEWENSIIDENQIISESIDENISSESYLIQSDYVLPIGENKQFEAGIRISNEDDITDYRVFDNVNGGFIEDLNQSNLFQYKEKISAVYTQYGVKVEDKYSFLFGLRVENTLKNVNQLTIQDFTKIDDTGLFPTFNFGLEISENETLTFGYNRRIRRPWSRFVNPFPTKISPILIWRGNPFLDPTYSNNLDIGYLKRFESSFTVNTSAYFQKSTNSINTIIEDTGEFAEINGVDVPIVERFPINLSTNERFGFELNLSYRKGRSWNINSNFNLFQNKVEGTYNDIVYDNKNVSWSFRLNNKLTLPGKIEWQTRMNVRGPNETAVSKSEGDFSIDLAFSKELFKDKATLTLNIRDLLDQRGWRNETFNENFYNDFEFRWSQRSATLNLTYRFNQKKNQNRRQMRRGGFEGGGFDF
jgi:outer membrane receptor protein involved in Fe transport